ncbi:MAG: EI24 domain-containing protein [Bacteroidota bacterium]
MFKDISSSISSYRYATRFLFQHGLWVYALLPGILSVVLLSGLYYGTISWLDVDTLEASIAQGTADWDGWFWGSLEWVVDKIVSAGAISFLVLMAFLIVFFFFGKYIVLIIAAPFMGPVSEKVEELYRGHKIEITSNFFSDLWRGIRISVRNLIREFFLTILFLFFNLIPVIGSLVGTVLTLGIQAYYAGFGNMDYTLERKKFGRKDSVRFVRQHAGLAIGNGTIFLLLFAIPFLGWFLAPAFATVAATVATIQRMEGK